MSGETSLGRVVDQAAGGVRAGLPPDFQIQSHDSPRRGWGFGSRGPPSTCSSAGSGEPRRRPAAPCAAPAVADAGELPRRHIRIILVVAQRLVVGRLALLAEVAAARLAAFERVERQQLGELEVVGHAAGVLEALVEVVLRAGHRDVVPELLAQLRNLLERVLQPRLVARHPDVVPQDGAERAVNRVDRLAALDRQQRVDALLNRVRRGLERVVIGRDLGQRRARQVVADRVGDDEVAVRQPLHQRAGAQPVGAVVGEVRFAEDVQPRHRAHQVVVHPEPAHRVVDGGVDAHRHLVRVLVGDLLVHLEEVAVLLLDRVRADALDRVLEVEVDRQAGCRRRRGRRRTPAWRCATRRRAARGCRSSGTSARGNSRARPRGSGRPPRVALLLRHPDAAVVAEALAHQRQLRLMLARDRDARRVDLREARVGEEAPRACTRATPPSRSSSRRWWTGSTPCRSRRSPGSRRRRRTARSRR